MSCEKFQNWLALQVEGDLAPRRQSWLERHLAACAACGEFARGLEESQKAVRALRGDPVSDEALVEVRGRVLSRIAASDVAGETAAWSFRALAACLVLLFLAVAVVVLRHGKATMDPRVASPAVPVSAAATPNLEEDVPFEKAGPTPPRTADRPRGRPRPQSEPLVVKLFTDDPDIVIIWLLESTEDPSDE